MGYRKLIIIEGPDGSGKSTLAENFVNALPELGLKGAISHGGPPEPTDSSPMNTLIVNALKLFRGADVVVMDRSPLSEQIYGPLLRGKVAGSEKEWAMWEALQTGRLNTFDLQMMVLDAPDDVLIQRAYKDRGEDYVPSEMFLDVVNGYRSRHDELRNKGWEIYESRG